MYSELHANYEGLSPEAVRHILQQELKALQLYNERYDNDVYTAAVDGQSAEYANELLDDAYALCGSPWFMPATRDSRDGQPAAQRFLALFE